MVLWITKALIKDHNVLNYPYINIFCLFFWFDMEAAEPIELNSLEIRTFLGVSVKLQNPELSNGLLEISFCKFICVSHKKNTVEWKKVRVAVHMLIGLQYLYKEIAAWCW